MNDLRSANVDTDRIDYFTCLFDVVISSDFRIVPILILLDCNLVSASID